MSGLPVLSMERPTRHGLISTMRTMASTVRAGTALQVQRDLLGGIGVRHLQAGRHVADVGRRAFLQAGRLARMLAVENRWLPSPPTRPTRGSITAHAHHAAVEFLFGQLHEDHAVAAVPIRLLQRIHRAGARRRSCAPGRQTAPAWLSTLQRAAGCCPPRRSGRWKTGGRCCRRRRRPERQRRRLQKPRGSGTSGYDATASRFWLFS